VTDAMQNFADDVNENLGDATATRHENEVAVSFAGDEETLTVDLEPLFRAGLRYGLVPFDGRAGKSVVELHFREVEH